MKAALYKGIREIEWQDVEYTPPGTGLYHTADEKFWHLW